MEQLKQSPDANTEEISLKYLIIKLQEWWRFLLGKWIIISFAALVGAGLGMLYAFLQKPSYVGELTFVLEESKSGSLGSYAGLASQFGVDLGGGSSVGVFSGDNILEFLKSRLMVEKTLLSSVTTNRKEQSLADLYLEIYGFREKWEKDEELKKISFPLKEDRKDFTRIQDSLLNFIYQSIIKKNLTISKPDKKLGFLIVKLVSPNEIFSKVFTERLVKEAIDFYVDTKTKRSKTNVDALQAKADSVEILLNRKTYSAAASQDINLNPARSMATVGTEMVSRDKVMLQTVYTEVVKNLEISKMTMAQETPIIQIIDTPILPLKKERFGKLKGVLAGGFLSVFFTTVIIICRRIFQQVML
jgi:hypothetical protein